METEVDDYKLNSNGNQQTLHVSILDNTQICIILINNSNNQRFSNYLTLQSLRNLSKAFLQTQTIQEAITLIKNTIEAGGIGLIEDSKEIILLNLEIASSSGQYPDFDIKLTLEENKVNNDKQEELASSNNQANTESEANYGNNTTDKTIIKSDVKPPIVQLEYIEPILQVHYPDGTTKSKALPPMIQNSDGSKMNISEDQFKAIQEHMNRNSAATIKNFSPIKNSTNNRTNSVSKKNTSMYSVQTTPTPYGNNMTTKNPFNANAVRPAMQNNQNISNINQVRSAFEFNPNTFNNTGIQNKNVSDYSSMTIQHNRPNMMGYNNYMNQAPTPTPTIANNFNRTGVFQNSQYNMQAFNMRNNNMIEERRPRMINNNNINNQRNAARSLSTPSHENKFNPNRNPQIYQSNNQANYNYQPNQAVYQQQNNYIKMPSDRIVGQPPTTPGLTYSQNQVLYNQASNQVNNNINQQRPNQNSAAIKQSQELIQLHQKRLQEVQKQLALIQQQQQKLQEQQKQLLLQQQMQRQIIQKQTLGNNAQRLLQGYNQANQNQMNRQFNNTQQYSIRQVQTSMNANPPFTHHSSQEIKQTKTITNQNANQIQNKNLAFRTQVSSPISINAPNLSNYQEAQMAQKNQSPQNKANNDNDEITEQQIALAQMASMQNQANPEVQNLKVITLEKKEEFNEEEQEPEQIQEQEQIQEEEKEIVETEGQNEEEQESINIEALFMTEEGRIIFRNGLCRGIIHKYAEIDDVITKIQDILLKGVKFELVYRAFEMGDKASIFHEKCDKLKMSLVLIETDKDIRFGGFTTKSWEGNNMKKKDKNAFVFNLENNSIFDIIDDEPAIGCYPKFGPVFFGCQIRIYDDFFSKGGTTCHKGLNYNTKEDYELNNGEQKYLIKDIEVYGIETIDI